MLSPAFAAVLILAILLIRAFWPYVKAVRFAAVSAVAYGVVFAFFSFLQTLSLGEEAFAGGGILGYGSAGWRESALMEEVKSFGSGRAVYTNAPDATYILAGRRTRFIPRAVNSGTLLPNREYGRELESMAADLRRTDGRVVYFDRVSWRWYLPTAEELVGASLLRLVETKSDGSVYEIGS